MQVPASPENDICPSSILDPAGVRRCSPNPNPIQLHRDPSIGRPCERVPMYVQLRESIIMTRARSARVSSHMTRRMRIIYPHIRPCEGMRMRCTGTRILYFDARMRITCARIGVSCERVVYPRIILVHAHIFGYMCAHHIRTLIFYYFMRVYICAYNSRTVDCMYAKHLNNTYTYGDTATLEGCGD